MRVVEAPDPTIEAPTDAVIRVVRSCVCGSDLHRWRNNSPSETGSTIGHECLGEVAEVGRDVARVRVGDLVIVPFTVSCGACEFCRAGLTSSCTNGSFWNNPASGTTGCQAEALRVPLADATLKPVPGVAADADEDLLASLLALSDVYPTGFHAAASAGVSAGDRVAVIGDGAVGLLAVLSARQLGAEQIVLMGRHQDRTDLGREFGATDVVASRGEEGIAQVLELTEGGAHKVLEAVGHLSAYEQAVGVARAGGTIARVGLPQYPAAAIGGRLFYDNITLTGGIAPARAYLSRLLPRVLDGTVRPGRVFDAEVPLADVAGAYQAMDQRQSLKVMLSCSATS